MMSLVLALSMALSLCLTGQKVAVTLDGRTIGTAAYVDDNNRTQIPTADVEKLMIK